MVLSIIIPIYNGQKYIKECLDSIFDSGSEQFEVLAIDDGSEDESEQILEEYAVSEKRLRVIRKDNGGVSETRNAGLSEARGSFILFVDIDDCLESGAIDAILQICSQNEDTDLVFGNYVEVSEKNEVLWDFPVADFISEDLNKMHHEIMTGYLCNACWAKIYKKEIIDRKSIRFDQSMKMGEDLKFVTEYCKYVSKIGGIHKSIYRYRQLESGAVLTNRSKLDEGNIRDLVKTMECKLHYAQDVGASNDFFEDMYVEFASNISASINLMIKTDASRKEKKKKCTLLMSQAFICDVMKRARKSPNCGIKRKIMCNMILNKWLRSIYIDIKLIRN